MKNLSALYKKRRKEHTIWRPHSPQILIASWSENRRVGLTRNKGVRIQLECSGLPYYTCSGVPTSAPSPHPRLPEAPSSWSRQLRVVPVSLSFRLTSTFRTLFRLETLQGLPGTLYLLSPWGHFPYRVIEEEKCPFYHDPPFYTAGSVIYKVYRWFASVWKTLVINQTRQLAKSNFIH